MANKILIACIMLVVLGCYHVFVNSMLGSVFSSAGDQNVRYVYVSLEETDGKDSRSSPLHANHIEHNSPAKVVHINNENSQANEKTRNSVAEADEEEIELDLSFDMDEIEEAPKQQHKQKPKQPVVESPAIQTNNEEANETKSPDEEEVNSGLIENTQVDDEEAPAEDDTQEPEEPFVLTGHVLPDDILDDRAEISDDSSWSPFQVNMDALEREDSAIATAAAEAARVVVPNDLPVDLSQLKPEDILCKDVSSKSRCGEIPHCYWGTDTHSCRTQLWAMECSMTKVKTTCAKLSKCTWASRSKTKGRYCVENLQNEEEAEVAEAEELMDPATLPCYKLTGEETCDKVDRCYWNTESKGCRTEPWAMTCNMTKVKSTCGKIPNCRWGSKYKTKGRYCVAMADKNAIVEIEEEDLTEEVDDGVSELVKVRIGNVTHTITRCKAYSNEASCSENDHCYWKDKQCLTEIEFVPCSSTKVKTTCDTLKHCIWPAKTLTKGKYCVDRYYLDNPEELGTKCSLLRSKLKCETQLACEWRSAKPSGRYCDRVVNLKEASRELHDIFPNYENGLVRFSKDPKTIRIEESGVRDNRYDCPKNIECQEPTALAPQLNINPSFLTSSTGYKMSRCCDEHDEILKMMRALTTHFVAVSFSDWWVDEGFALGMYRMSGAMPPWQKSHSVSMVHKSSRAVKAILDRFNKGFFYRPYLIKGCEVRSTKSRTKSTRKSTTETTGSTALPGDAQALEAEPAARRAEELAAMEASASASSAVSSSPTSRYSCKPISKISSKHTILFYEIVNMDQPDAAKLRIYPRITTRTSKRCVTGPKSKPVPLDFVLPAKPCPFPLYGNDKVQCPHLPLAYLDLLYTTNWRTDPVPVSEALRMPNVATDYEVDLDVNRTTADSTFASKLVWLNLRHCADTDLEAENA